MVRDEGGVEMEILLIRHGESEADILNVHEGRADFSLTDLGRQQVSLMAKKVKLEFPPDFIWASTLQRASETGELLSETVNCPVKYEEQLMEFNNGVQAGLSFEEAKKYPKPQYLHDRYRDGESHIEFRMRIESIFSEIISVNNYNRIAIVAHGGVINCILHSFFGMGISKDYYFKLGDTSISFLELVERNKIVHFINNISHLDPLKQLR